MVKKYDVLTVSGRKIRMFDGQWEKNTNWMTMKHECSWYGVNCNMMRTIVELDLAYIEMEGLIPRELGLLTAITDIDLHGNDLQGKL